MIKPNMVKQIPLPELTQPAMVRRTQLQELTQPAMVRQIPLQALTQPAMEKLKISHMAKTLNIIDTAMLTWA